MLYIGNQQYGVLISQNIKIFKPKSLKIEQSRFELVSHTRSKQSGTLVDDLSEAVFWDFEVNREEIENWDKVCFDVGSEDLRTHAKDSR